MIKRIELVNFMSHERTVIEPAAGLTVLVGPNNCGKSAFVSALQILSHNAKSNYVLRHDAKHCEIIVETHDGHIVNWSKKKSGSPKYVINGEEFDRLRQGIPKELHEILGLSKVACEKDTFDIHFGEQKSPVFLLNDSGKAAAQFFASSSDAIRLVEMQDKHKTKVRLFKRDQNRLSQRKEQLSEDIETLEPLDSIEKRLAECEQQYVEINQSEEQIEQIEILIQAIREIEISLAQQNATTDALGKLKEPPKLDDAKSLDRLIANLQKVETAHRWSAASLIAFSELAEPPEIKDESQLAEIISDLRLAQHEHDRSSELATGFAGLEVPPKLNDVAPLSQSIAGLNSAQTDLNTYESRNRLLSQLASPPELTDQSPLESILKEFAKTNKAIAASTKELKNIDGQVDLLNEEVESWVEVNPSCPTCGGETTVDQLIGIGREHRHG